MSQWVRLQRRKNGFVASRTLVYMATLFASSESLWCLSRKQLIGLIGFASSLLSFRLCVHVVHLARHGWLRLLVGLVAARQTEVGEWHLQASVHVEHAARPATNVPSHATCQDPNVFKDYEDNELKIAYKEDHHDSRGCCIMSLKRDI